VCNLITKIHALRIVHSEEAGMSLSALSSYRKCLKMILDHELSMAKIEHAVALDNERRLVVLRHRGAVC